MLRLRSVPLAGALLLACLTANGAEFDWPLPSWAPRPIVPADNPMSADKVALGRYLFFDRRLSLTGKVTCATCHDPARGFTDARRTAIGATGEPHPRSSMSLANVAYNPVLTWADPRLTTLEAQALVPMFGRHPVEMGLAGREQQIVQLIEHDPRYQRMFRAAFGDAAKAFTIPNLVKSIASFERSLLSFDSPFDRARYGGDASAMSARAKRGEALFFSRRFACFHCHGGINMTDSVMHQRLPHAELGFHNTGLYNLASMPGNGAYPADNTGLAAVTGKPEDMGRFRAPTLRNIALTAPYMHDGSIATLSAVIDHYAAGGRTLRSGPLRGVGARNPHKSTLIRGFRVTRHEKVDLIAFLESLTDPRFIGNPEHADPFAAVAPLAPTSQEKTR